jgi:hypothetical protein
MVGLRSFKDRKPLVHRVNGWNQSDKVRIARFGLSKLVLKCRCSFLDPSSTDHRDCPYIDRHFPSPTFVTGLSRKHRQSPSIGDQADAMTGV